MDLVALAQQATDILVPALSALCIAGKPVVDKGREVLGDMIYEKSFEKLGKESAERATLLLKKINPKIGSSLEKAIKKVSGNPEDSTAKQDLQQEILKLFKDNQDLARDIELIVNINIKIDVVKQLVFGNNNLILNLEGIKGEELIKIEEYRDCKRQEELKQEVLKSYSPSVLPDYSENLIKFVTENRAKELSEALVHLQKNKIILFSGIAGIGKTTLARVLINFRPKDILEPFWFNFYHNRDANLEDVLEALAAYLEAPEILSFKGKRQAGSTDINRLTEELRKRNYLWLVFDDLSYILNEERKFKDPEMDLFFTSLHENTHRAKIIVTSRILPLLKSGKNLIDPVNEKKQRIEGLTTDFAVEFLKENGLDDVEHERLKELVISVGGHPLALEILIGLVKDFGVEDTLNDLSEFKVSREETIKIARKLFEKLAGDEKELLERISVYRRPEPRAAIKYMFMEKTSENSIKKLTDKSLLETDHNGNYWLHPLVQEFSYEDMKNKKETHILAVKYYLSLPLPKNPTKKEDIQPAIEAYNHACEAEGYDLAAVILSKYDIPYLLHLWSNPRALIEIYEKLLPEDHFIYEPILKNKKVYSIALGGLGAIYSDLGEPRKAIKYCEQALKITKEIRNRRGEGACLGSLGVVYSGMGELKKAIEYHEQALKIARETGDKRGECADLGNLGNAYNDLGEIKKAIEYYEQALRISREIGYRRGEGTDLGNMGNLYSNLGDQKKAIEFLKQSLAIGEEIEDPRIVRFCERKLKELEGADD